MKVETLYMKSGVFILKGSITSLDTYQTELAVHWCLDLETRW
jgi:hypothetical protein